MPKVEISYPENTCFVQHTRVRINDLSNAGHLGAAHLVSILDEAAASFFKSHGIERKPDRTVGVIFADLMVSYRSEAFHGDELKIEIALQKAIPKGLDLCFRVSRSDSAKLVALAKIGILFYNYQTRRVIDVPRRFSAL